MKKLAILGTVSFLSFISVLPTPAKDALSADELIEKGDQLMQKAKYKEASGTFREATRLYPDNARSHQRLGAALAALDDYETAILEEKTAIKLDPKYFLSHVVLGHIYANQQKKAEAIAEIKQAASMNPNSYGTQMDLAVVYLEDGQVEPALEALRRAAALKPDRIEPYIKMGILLAKLGKVEEAVKAEQEAININGRAVEAHVAMGNIYLDDKQYTKAVEPFKTALQYAPNHPNALSGLGWVISRPENKGSLEEGIQLQRRALKIYPQFLPGYVRLAELLAESGNRNGAIAEFNNALKLNPDDPMMRTAYAQFLQKMGKITEAKQEYKRVLNKTPHFKPAMDGFASLPGSN